jgi:hypothetical protein
MLQDRRVERSSTRGMAQWFQQLTSDVHKLPWGADIVVQLQM